MKVKIVFSCMILIMNLVSCNQNSNEAAYNKVVNDDITFKDTLIQYTLTSDSLVLEFTQPQKHRDWLGEIFICMKDRNPAVHIYDKKSPEGELGGIAFKNGKVAFGGFHLPEDSLDFFEIRFRAVPYFPGKEARGDVYVPLYLFLPDEKRKGFLVLNPNVKDLSIVTFDALQFAKLSPADQEYCEKKMKEKYGVNPLD